MNRFQETERIRRMVDSVYTLTEMLERGQYLTFEAVGLVLDLRPHEGSWDHVMRKVARRLERERGIAFWPNFRDGYKLCTTAEQLTLPSERAQRGLRQIKRGRKSVEALPENSLSHHQRRLRAFLADNARAQERSIRRDLKSMREQIKPTAPLPRRPSIVA